MEEINNVSTGTYDDWSDIDFSDIMDDEAIAEPETEAEPVAKSAEPDTEAEEEANHSETEAEAEPAVSEPAPEKEKEADHSFTLKYMGEERNVSRDEAVALAQKGMDYDRIKGKLDEANQLVKANAEMVEFVKYLAKEMGAEPEVFMLEVKAGNLAKKENISLDEAKRKLELDRREQAIAAREQAAQTKADTASAEEAQKAKIRAELAEFADAFPNVKATEIPREVFQTAAQRKLSLTTAYAMYEAKEAKAALEAEKQNARNKALAVGSASTSGKRKQADEFEDAWYDGT